MTRRTALIAFLALAAAGGVWRLSRPPPPSDEELIRTLYDDAVRAAEERRVSDAVAGVSERFQGQGLDKRGVKQLVAAHALRGNWLVVRIAGLRIEVTGDTARAALDLVATRAGAGKTLADQLPTAGNAWRVDCRLEREAEGWRIVAATWAEETLVEALEG
jgi:SnoaL-like domain